MTWCSNWKKRGKKVSRRATSPTPLVIFLPSLHWRPPALGQRPSTCSPTPNNAPGIPQAPGYKIIETRFLRYLSSCQCGTFRGGVFRRQGILSFSSLIGSMSTVPQIKPALWKAAWLG